MQEIGATMADNLAAYVEESMTNLTRSLVLSLMIVSISAVGAYFINSFLVILEHSAGLPLAALYEPLASLISNVITSNIISNQKAVQALENLRTFFIIQSGIFVILAFAAARLSFLRPNPKSVLSAFLFSLFIIPGIAIRELSLPIFLHSELPDLTLFTSQRILVIVLQLILSVPFYALIFFAGTAILTDGEPTKTQPLATNIK
jgi:hypothetical protein